MSRVCSEDGVCLAFNPGAAKEDLDQAGERGIDRGIRIRIPRFFFSAFPPTVAVCLPLKNHDFPGRVSG